MKKIGFLILMCMGLIGYAQDDMTQKSIDGLLEMTQGQIVALANAFDDSQMDWRPAPGIRSTGETILHVAAANYYLAMKLGFPPPEGVDVMKMETITGRENILEAYNASTAFVREKMMAIDPGSLNEEVDLGFAKMNRLSALMVVLEHTGEHKGQLIAYARSNGVTPPWSQPQ
ncbi:DinB family protein [Robiginitalea sp.]|uniref:DinB family protein n=1 Tax=Robiginitalea sp. TaxID=1902411 RepID=UPI003C706C09